MVKAINHIIGNLVFILALIRLKNSPSFKIKKNLVKNEIKESNKKATQQHDDLILSIIAIEDRRYFNHKGVDFYSVIRASLKNLSFRKSRIEGASTIVQQLIRSITNEREISFKGKINEIMLAILINEDFNKTEILKAYTDLYVFNSCVGINNLCMIEKYNTENLTIHDYAELAARFKYPNITKTNYIKFLKRVRTIERKITLNNN